MTTISNDNLASLITPYESLIRDAILTAWAEYLNDEKRSVYCSRTRANIVWDVATAALEAALDPLPSMHVDRSNNSCLFMISQSLAFRFKKADANGISSNYPTQMAISFHDPKQHCLGIPDAVKAELVYTLNKLETEITGIKLVRRNADTVVWQHEIYDANTNKVIPILPVQKEHSDNAIRKKRVSAKGRPQEGASDSTVDKKAN